MQPQIRVKRRKQQVNVDGTGTPTRTQHLTARSRFEFFRLCIVLPLCLAAAACSDAPSVAVLGAYFPDWLFCIVGAVLLVACVHVLLQSCGRDALLNPPAIVYPALTVLFAAALWAVGFNL
ncbi:hypothetical protein bAD24_III10340 [Burkholderia sp. AD24]|nr:hypothetical protein bAD24_III10340 [Burkholderia sp. AD24]